MGSVETAAGRRPHPWHAPNSSSPFGRSKRALALFCLCQSSLLTSAALFFLCQSSLCSAAALTSMTVPNWTALSEPDYTRLFISTQPLPSVQALTSGIQEHAMLDVEASPQHLAQIDKAGNSHIAAAALSPDGLLAAISDAERLRVYALHNPATPGAGQQAGSSQRSTQAASPDAPTPAGKKQGKAGQDKPAASEAPAASSGSSNDGAVSVPAGRLLHSEAQAGLQLHLQAVPEGLPALVELAFRPASAELLGLTAAGELLVVDLASVEVRNSLTGWL